MPKLSPNSITLLDGNIILSQRNESAKWQARFKVENRWIRITTKENGIKEAMKAAEDLYLDARYRVKHELPAQTKVLVRMDTALSLPAGLLHSASYSPNGAQ